MFTWGQCPRLCTIWSQQRELNSHFPCVPWLQSHNYLSAAKYHGNRSKNTPRWLINRLQSGLSPLSLPICHWIIKRLGANKDNPAYHVLRFSPPQSVWLTLVSIHLRSHTFICMVNGGRTYRLKSIFSIFYPHNGYSLWLITWTGEGIALAEEFLSTRSIS